MVTSCRGEKRIGKSFSGTPASRELSFRSRASRVGPFWGLESFRDLLPAAYTLGKGEPVPVPYATIPHSSYLDLYGYRITDQSTVEMAYGMNAANVGNPAFGVNVALVLPRAHSPAFLAEDWATRQKTIADYNKTESLWSTFGADRLQFDRVKQQIEDRGLTVIESGDTTYGNYVTSAESRTIWVHIDTAADFTRLFSTQAQLLQWSDPNGGDDLFWNGPLALPTEWNVSAVWLDIANGHPNPSPQASVAEVTLGEGPQSIGNASPSQPDVSPRTIAQGYDFPLDGQLVQTGTIALIEPGVGSALEDESQSLQQQLAQYLASIDVSGSGTVYTQGADGQSYYPDGSNERWLDVGIVAAVNPNSDIWLYTGSGNKGGAESTTFSALQSAIWDTTNDPAVISSSWSDLVAMWPTSPFYRAYWDLIVDAVLRNQTILRDSYDGGSGNEIGNGITNVFATNMSPYGIVVGGTSLSNLTDGPDDAMLNTQIIQPALAGDMSIVWQLVAGGLTSLPTNAAPLANFVETVWNEYYVQDKTIGGYNGAIETSSGFGGNYAVSGGVDSTQPVPSYQDDYGLLPVTSDPLAAIGRGVPDVAALAGGNLDYLVPGDWDRGTSAATPLWATLISQYDFIFADQGLPNLGYMNDLLYIASAIAPASFNDITLGNNISSFVAGQGTYKSDGEPAMPTGFGYNAGSGYDLVTGLGTPNGVLLGRALTAIAHEQMSFDSIPDVLDLGPTGVWKAGANETVSVQAVSGGNTNMSLALAGTDLSFSSAPSANFAWTSQFAGQVLQSDFDPALVRLFDNQAQAFAGEATLSLGGNIEVAINGTSAQATQGNLTADFGFADFTTSAGAVRLARTVMVAETAGGADGQIAIARVRQNGMDSVAVTFFKVDDYTGSIGNLHPGDPGYAAAAQAHAYQLSTGGTALSGPGYGGYTQAAILNVNARDLMAQMLVDRTTGHTFWSFAQANESVNGQHVVHQWNYGLNVVGWEDGYGSGDADFNDLVVGVDFTSASGHWWLV